MSEAPFKIQVFSVIGSPFLYPEQGSDFFLFRLLTADGQTLIRGIITIGFGKILTVQGVLPFADQYTLCEVMEVRSLNTTTFSVQIMFIASPETPDGKISALHS